MEKDIKEKNFTAKKKPLRRKEVAKKDDEKILDYSHSFSNFYDIFAGMHIDPKSFDLNFAVRDSRNIYASFVNLMDTKAVAMK